MSSVLRTALLVSVTGAVIAPVSMADIIGLDNRNGFSAASYLGTGVDYEELRALIQDLGHTIVPLSTFTAADLVGLDAVITHMPYSSAQSFTTAEIDALHDFVANGGGHLIHADGGGSSDSYVSNINTLAAPYGVTFRSTASNPSGLVVSAFNPHPVTDGVGSFGIDFQRAIATINAPGIDLTVNSGDENVMAAADGTGSSGNVALVSDTSCWKDAGAGSDYGLADLDNALVMTNLINYILGGGGQRLEVAVSGNCPGTTRLDISGATPNANLAIVYGFGAGPTIIPNTFPCGGTSLDVGNPNLDYQVVRADASGNAIFQAFAPSNACGRARVQALDLTTCATSNVVTP